MRNLLVLTVALLASVSVAGCLDPHRPVVDPDALAASTRPWVVTKVPAESGGAFGPNSVQTEVRFDPADGGSGYPGVLLLIGIRTVSRIDTEELLERTRDIVGQALDDEGVVVDASKEVTGTRTIENEATTSWFFITGEATEGDGPFASQEEVRVLGETWYDGRSKTHVVAVAMAQTTDTNLIGDERRDHAVWNELVGDATGSIGGATSNHGFIDHVLSH